MDESSCPSNWILVEGVLPSFTCKAEGIPPPEVTCTKDGMTYYLSQGQGIPLYNGTFWCNATNRLGTVAKAVAVTVESECWLWSLEKQHIKPVTPSPSPGMRTGPSPWLSWVASCSTRSPYFPPATYFRWVDLPFLPGEEEEEDYCSLGGFPGFEPL